MSILQAIILGVIQGITEFLPVSSSGHLQLAKEILGVHITENLTFDIALHAGTVCSTILILWSEIRWMVRGFFVRGSDNSRGYGFKIAISMIPVAIVGFTCKDYLEEVVSSRYMLVVVGSMLLITALLLAFASYSRRKDHSQSGHEIGYGDAFIIGLAQAAAVMPGLSRSGATIATGILLGNNRGSVAKFSFLMVLIPILGNTFLDLVKGGGEISIAGVSSMALLAGFLASFIVGLIACRTMIEIVKRGNLYFFALYCLLAGLFSIGSYLLIR